MTITIDRQDASAILGWMSIACWVLVYSPQIWENYVLQSGEGVSIAFLVIWLAGDFCNLSGAVFAGLLPTVIILAIYYIGCDIILLLQIYYYRWKRNLAVPAVDAGGGESTPLLTPIPQESKTSVQSVVVQYTAAMIFVIATGFIAWNLTYVEVKPPGGPEAVWHWSTQVLGWTATLLFLGARIPQIHKNTITHCVGLSPALFFFTTTGNATYAASILAASTDRDYLLINASWLAGSTLTIFLDLFVIGQCIYYRVIDGREESSTVT